MNRICCFLLLFGLLFSCCSCNDSHKDGVQLYFLDVGEGDCILLRSLEGDALIDVGPSSQSDRVCFALEKLGVERLEYVVITHFDEDHLGGGERLISKFDVGELLLPTQTDESVLGKRFLALARKLGIKAESVSGGDEVHVGEMTLRVLSPLRDVKTTDNDGSIVLQMRYRDARALLMADAELATEDRLLSFYGKEILSSQLCKIGHHGSSTSTTERFLDAVTPKHAVISVGAENSYGHPHGEVLEALEERGVEIYRTDLEGTVYFYCDGKEFIYEGVREE